MRRILSYILPFLFLLILSCEEKEDICVNGYANLNISVSAPTYNASIDTKGIEDGVTPDGTWDNSDKLKDGRIMDRTFIGIIDASGALVAYRILYKGAPDVDTANGLIPEGESEINVDADYGYRAEALFLYDTPKRSSETLKVGEYTLFILANYSVYNGVNNLIQGIIDSFNSSAGIPGFSTSTNWNTLKNYSVTPHNGLYSGDKMPLSIIRKLTLAPGDNSIEVELLRQFARIRFEIKNYSNTKNLDVNDFYLSNNFAQESSLLMWNYDQPDDVYNSVYVRPAVRSERAITPYTETSDKKTIGTESSAILFDGFIPESKHDDPYVYHLEISYPNTGNYLRITPADVDPVKEVSDLSAFFPSNGAVAYFAIRHASSTGRYISEDQSSRQLKIPHNGDPALACLQDDFSAIWKFTRIGNNQYTVQNVASGRYMRGSNSNSSTVDTQLNSASISVRDGEDNTDGIHIYKTPGWRESEYYLNIWGGINSEVIGTYNALNDSGSLFYLIPFNVVTSPSASEDIVLSTIDPVTAMVSQTKEIARNDYIHILIEAYFNDNNGSFRYEVVKEWETGGGQIEFN